MRTFRSSTNPGFTDLVSTDPRHVVAIKREQAVKVRFAHEACSVQTREGVVYADRDDAIITGPGGERWPVPQERFAEKYRALAPTENGKSGTYVALPNSVLALEMSEPFEVVLADGQTTLDGRPGDWLIDYGDGSLGVVAADIFPNTYDTPDEG